MPRDPHRRTRRHVASRLLVRPGGRVIGLAVLALLVACSEGGLSPERATFEQAVTAVVDGTAGKYPGIGINDTSVAGETLGSVVLGSLALGGKALADIRLEGTIFVARSGDRILRGREVVGATLKGRLTSGAAALLRIDGISSSAVGGDVYFYAVSYQGLTGWMPLCPEPNQAVPVAGVWDYREGVAGGGARIATVDMATFSCRTGAISRCLEIGYKPWRAVPTGAASAESYFQACVRMMRADYCGDGRSWTVQGVLVNVYDGLKWQVDTQSWQAEAEWTAAGATCVAAQRVHVGGMEPPPCALPRAAVRGACGAAASFRSGTLLINELLKPLRL